MSVVWMTEKSVEFSLSVGFIRIAHSFVSSFIQVVVENLCVVKFYFVCLYQEFVAVVMVSV